jgi:lysophospholipase L1-like esterase
VVPFSVDRSKELDPSNLFECCRYHHFWVGHFGDWRTYNPDVRADAAAIRSGLTPMPVLVVGDSHAASYLPHGGPDAQIVADLLGVPASRRMAHSGSTADQWASGYNGWLCAATNCRAPVVWVSLGGNDVAAALSDGRIDDAERAAISASLYASAFALAQRRRLFVGTLYADPWRGARTDAARGLLELDAGISNIVVSACRAAGTRWALLDERAVLSEADFDGSGDLHPAAAGYTNMALRLRAIIKGDIGK